MIEIPKSDFLSLGAILKQKKVDELKRIALLLGVVRMPEKRKTEIIDSLAEHILEDPQRLVDTAFHYELIAWRDIMDGKLPYKQAFLAGFTEPLNRFGLVYVKEGKKKDVEPRVYFSQEVAELIRPLLDAEIERRETDGSLECEKIALGLANAYGVTDIKTIFNYVPEMEELVGRELDNNEVADRLFPVIAEVYLTMDPGPFFSPFVEFVGFYSDEIEWDEEPKEFDVKTLLDLGEMPYPKFDLKYAGDFIKELAKNKNAAAELSPYAVLRHLYLDKQRSNDDFAMPDLSLLPAMSGNGVDKMVEAMIKFTNCVPYWKFQGNSSEEIAHRNRKKMRATGQMPQITMGPNLRAMGINSWEQLEEMARNGEELPPVPGSGVFDEPFIGGPKVGRNDPCPCGSGKKYKHCCGR